ncbi:Uncharacterized protein yubM [Salmonella enterica subsp. arizonae]|uniref:Uncharacterized protein yubM n=1 Tax=Salmonella enterica subsp. arizonae TaxID=59203 RepID=A0A379T3K5_SALER|nr:Uncharacterized protein yubM [Salmonella enterica subsp. arizonae]
MQKKPQNETKEGQGENGSSGSLHVVSSKPDVTEGISAPLLKKMSSERTLAVQAALVQQPEKSGGPDGMATVQLCFRLLQYHPSSVRDAS